MISILMPYYNKRLYVKESIISVIDQSFKDFELIIIYDDETKKDLDYIKSLEKMDKRIKLIINQKNLGAGLSRNRGIDYAKGEFIAFIDSDDLWRKDKLQKQITIMKKNNYDFSHTDYEIIDQDGKIRGKRVAKNFFQVNDLIKSCDIGLSTVILSKKILSLEKRFPNLKTKEDFILWLKILEYKIPIYSINETLTSWRKLENSLSSSLIQKLKDAFIVYNKYMKFNFFKSIYYILCLSINYIKKNK